MIMNGDIRIGSLSWQSVSDRKYKKRKYEKMNATTMGRDGVEARLREIAETPFGALTDDETLELLAERKDLSALLQSFEQEERERREAAEKLKREQEETQMALEALNKSITADKSDDDLLRLIRERQALEEKLGKSTQTAETLTEAPETSSSEAVSDMASAEAPESALESTHHDTSLDTVGNPTIKMEQSDDEFGRERISIDRTEETGELKQYLDQLAESIDSLGSFLQGVPAAMKANRTFMRKVAEIDPAYAMHYADESLKRDESFNIDVVSIPNRRHSGNVLAEMLPEARTARVVMIGIQQDYRNIRFAAPDMEGYREMIDIAKKGTLEQVASLKDGADVAFLVPKILQKDQEFMRQAAALALPPQEEADDTHGSQDAV
jgi:hypothetical protein